MLVLRNHSGRIRGPYEIPDISFVQVKGLPRCAALPLASLGGFTVKHQRREPSESSAELSRLCPEDPPAQPSVSNVLALSIWERGRGVDREKGMSEGAVPGLRGHIHRQVEWRRLRTSANLCLTAGCRVKARRLDGAAQLGCGHVHRGEWRG